MVIGKVPVLVSVEPPSQGLRNNTDVHVIANSDGDICSW